MKYRVTIDINMRGESPSFLEVKDFISNALVTYSEKEYVKPGESKFGDIQYTDITMGSIVARGKFAPK